MPNLTLAGLTKRFDTSLAVDDVCLSIAPGEFVSLLGPSGCGKTTTLRMIAGFETADAGTIRLDGADITRLPPQKRDIGFVFQSYALFPHKTVAENVGFGLKMRRLARADIDDQVRRALDLVRLGHLPERYPRQLSGGQQQRVALARALAIRPRLLLMDEPLSNLDARLRDEMREEIRRIQKDLGITAVFVTHDQSEALALADRIAVMSNGRLIQVADPTTIYERPATSTVDNFIGQVNALPGVITEVKHDAATVEISGGHSISGAAGDMTSGVPVVVMVKHERVLLSSNLPADTENALRCRVETRTYLGPSIVYRCGFGNQSIIAATPNHPGFARFEVGDAVYARWARSDCRIYPR
jgi:putative spermidine/putrescine transport system ATP-binding protein